MHPQQTVVRPSRGVQMVRLALSPSSACSSDALRGTVCWASLVVPSCFVKKGNVSSLSAGRLQRNFCTAATRLRQAMHETVL